VLVRSSVTSAGSRALARLGPRCGRWLPREASGAQNRRNQTAKARKAAGNSLRRAVSWSLSSVTLVCTAVTTSLLCPTCGERASHVHFLPWIEQPERIELACARHEPADENEWFTLAEIEAEPTSFLGALERCTSLSPDALKQWLTSLTTKRPEITAAAPGEPLTVAQAAEREKVSQRTVQRWLEHGELGTGAWQVGKGKRAHWRIDEAALDQRRTRPRARRRTQTPKPSDISTGTKSTAGVTWPT
jgi:excisionase family DNA binding protein